MSFVITKDTLDSINLNKQVYETEEQFLDRVVFYLCCIDNGITTERAETLCNVYRNKCKYKVKYADELEKEIAQITNKYNIK